MGPHHAVALAWVDVFRRGAETITTGEVAAVAVTALVDTGRHLDRRRPKRIGTLAPNRLRVRFRVRAWTLRDTDFGAGSTIQVEHHRDSDNDDRYALAVTGRGRRRVLATALHDPYELLALAEWLSGRTQFTFQQPPAL